MSDGTSDRVAVAHFLRFHPRASENPKLLLSRLAAQDLGSASRLSSMRLNREDLSAAAQRRLARLLDSVPDSAATRFAGGPRSVDGQVLDPHLALLITVDERIRPPEAVTSVQEQRAINLSAARIAAGTPIAVGPIRDLTIQGAAGPLRARHYTPPTLGTDRPLVVFFHGGGWVVGSVDSHDQPCRLISRYADVHVLSVDYRLAPEHPFPAAVDDGLAAYRWARDNAATLGVRSSKIAVAGDSAGGNIAAVICQSTRDQGITPPAAQLLIYPATDGSVDRPSKDLFGEGFFLSRPQMDTYWDTYRVDAPHDDPRLSPLCADNLAELAPALIAVAAMDPLRDEGEAYGAALRAAGVQVTTRRAAGLVHGFFSMTGIHRASFDESIAIAGAFGALLDLID
jgi:acetyl esterase